VAALPSPKIAAGKTAGVMVAVGVIVVGLIATMLTLGGLGV
jgi:hypothetical protein